MRTCGGASPSEAGRSSEVRESIVAVYYAILMPSQQLFIAATASLQFHQYLTIWWVSHVASFASFL